VQGAAADIDRQAQEILRLKKELEQILVDHTGQDMERIKVDTDRDYFMRAVEAKEYGIVDNVIETAKK
jgi:ATP-dependent Clp protease protease subunit